MQEIPAATIVHSVMAAPPEALDLQVGTPVALVGGATRATVGQSISLPDAPPKPFIGPIPSQDPQQLVQGTRLLQQLSLLPESSIAQFVNANPATIAELIAKPPVASQVTGWWTSLSPGAQSAMMAASPSLVGNLDGVPFTARDQANRQLLRTTIAELNREVSSVSGRTVVESARQQLRMLQSIDAALDTGGAGPSRTLMTLDVTGQGRAAIIVGDLNTADYVSYLVPGMFFTIENQMSDWVDAATRLYDQEREWLDHFGDTTSTVATVAWIGYHTPNLTNVAGIDNALEGRDSLAHAIEGLQAIRTGNEPYLSVIAHSYGSTAALMALTEYNFQVDALAVVGSPGSPAKSVAQLHVKDGNVWVGEAPWDPVPNSACFGSDPGAKSYGAKKLGVNGGLDSLTDVSLQSSTGHNEYFSPGTESMRNFALLAIGKGAYVMG